MSFYERITALCRQRGTNISNVVKELGIGSSRPTDWKNGNMPSVENLLKLAFYFKCTTDYLLCFDDLQLCLRDNADNDIEEVGVLSDAECRLIKGYRKGSLDAKRKVNAILMADEYNSKIIESAQSVVISQQELILIERYRNSSTDAKKVVDTFLQTLESNGGIADDARQTVESASALPIKKK